MDVPLRKPGTTSPGSRGGAIVVLGATLLVIISVVVLYSAPVVQCPECLGEKAVGDPAPYSIGSWITCPWCRGSGKVGPLKRWIHRNDSAKEAGSKVELLCKVRPGISDKGRWKVIREISVFSDGTYVSKELGIGSAHSGDDPKGKIPSTVFALLKKGLAQSKLFTLENGIPTHSIGVDDATFKHPEGIGELCSFVESDIKSSR
jgi:hypothetical protein